MNLSSDKYYIVRNKSSIPLNKHFFTFQRIELRPIGARIHVRKARPGRRVHLLSRPHRSSQTTLSSSGPRRSRAAHRKSRVQAFQI